MKINSRISSELAYDKNARESWLENFIKTGLSDYSKINIEIFSNHNVVNLFGLVPYVMHVLMAHLHVVRICH